MPNKKDFDTDKAKEIFIHTFERCGCNINISCKAADITRRCFYYWLDDDKDFAEKVEDAKQGLIDFAESKLVEMMKGGNPTALIFFLKCKGKDRGWIERQEIQQEVIEKLPSHFVIETVPDRKLEEIEVDLIDDHTSQD